MKVTGPGSGAPPEGPGAAEGVAGKTGPQGPSSTSGVEAPEASGRTFAETLGADRSVKGPAAAKGAGVVDPLTADIAADLKAGKIDPQAALDRVVERVLDQQLGANAPPALRAQLRDVLRETMSSDPALTDRLRP
jgi:hypothetical protein